MASQRRPHPGRLGAQGIFDYGEAVGAATVVTLAGNFLIIAAARSFNEALTMADKSGVDVYAVVGETARWRREPNTCLGSDWRPRDSDRQTIASGNQTIASGNRTLGSRFD